MIKKILIANRGEIAARIIHACKKLHIHTVAIYSEADQDSPYVQLADECYLIGPPHVNESYLNVEKIVEVAKKAEVDAIHPGYGFMSENGDFARKCQENGFIFIGPSANIIETMGDKVAARKLMKEAGVPIIPGTENALSNIDEAVSAAEEIGYPIMLKAAAGGGGIGMQVVHNDDELIKAFDRNAKRAESFFGDGSMFIEKLLKTARHIEIQVLADQFGHVIHLFERECSIQRRNQKVIEEAPALFLSEQTRLKMGEVAVQATKQIGYTNAGTIEFLVDEQENFYFLEMNTRIQVEHPITEEITGVDIVSEQINIASGERLTLHQNDIQIDGHAIEVRIYAEDPKTFFPSPGKITKYEEPTGDNIRIESSIREGSNVTPFYDPMISKLIVSGNSRDEAITYLKEALHTYKIDGIKTNIPMLLTVIDHEQFKKGNISTNFVQEYV
ncbi:acetyl-CoA carboxylase biotin carboxylase subunit [Pseudogracilibacillus auburnensis]|uniref:acetyl-CoA carboxylase biotin carboxylase subunit n=1 Tax=Pseudogracilibacillus auburnensis TaxID=1494959 RepID=UPI001A966750|nr:acetyl-CoA carboxylase biotin carboxylase subunit [Pseudogracilibacillus auburnensis]MBO1004590.1 acetyl-CoA carboxylase biotin carboxylase subunit [Pseudogracilibacillus auburnensis]